MIIANNIVARELTNRGIFPYRIHQNNNDDKKNKYNKYLIILLIKFIEKY